MICLTSNGVGRLQPLQLSINQNSELLVFCEVLDPVRESQMATMRTGEHAGSFNWKLKTLRNSSALPVYIKLLSQIDVPAFAHRAVLRLAKWISNTAAVSQKARPFWEVRPLLNSWRIMACPTWLACFSRLERSICIIDFLIKPCVTELACISVIATLTSSASFAAVCCLHCSLEFVCLGMRSRANPGLH